MASTRRSSTCDDLFSATRNAFAYVFAASPFMSPELARRCVPFVVSISRNADWVTRLSVLSLDQFILELTQTSAPNVVKRWLQAKFSKRVSDPAMRAFGGNVA